MSVTIEISNSLTFKGGSGTNDGDAVFARTGTSGGETSDVSQFDTFEVFSTAGSCKVVVSIDDTNYTTTALALSDQQDTTAALVASTSANKIYGFRGKFSKIRVLQNGATAVVAATLRCGVMGIRS